MMGEGICFHHCYSEVGLGFPLTVPCPVRMDVGPWRELKWKWRFRRHPVVSRSGDVWGESVDQAGCWAQDRFLANMGRLERAGWTCKDQKWYKETRRTKNLCGRVGASDCQILLEANKRRSSSFSNKIVDRSSFSGGSGKSQAIVSWEMS